jgi:hypothetical protein
MTTDSIQNADHRMTARAAYGVASQLRGQSRDLLTSTRHPGSTLAASWIASSVAETVRAFEETLRELAFRVQDPDATARLDMAAGLLAAGRSLTEDASALLADTGLGSSELAELRAAGLARNVPGPEAVPLARAEPMSVETFNQYTRSLPPRNAEILDRYTRGLPPRNPAEQILISRLATLDFTQAWEQARDDHLFPPSDTSSPGHSACQPGACPFDGPVPAGPAAATAARNLSDRIREEHFAHETPVREPGPHYEPGHYLSGTCAWESAVLPPVERAARALAREHLPADAPSERPGPARSSTARSSRRVTANEPGKGKAGTRMPRPPHALATESFPHGPAAGMRPDNGAGTSSGQSTHGAARRQPDQSQRATRRLR